MLERRRQPFKQHHRPVSGKNLVAPRDLGDLRDGSLIRAIAGCDRHPKAWRRKRAANVHFCLAPFGIEFFPTTDDVQRWRGDG